MSLQCTKMSQVSKTDCSSSIISANHMNFIFSYNEQYWIYLIMILSDVKCKYQRPICSCHLLSELFLGTYTKLQKATISFIMSTCPSVWKNSTPTGRIFKKFDICWFFKNLSRKFMFHCKNWICSLWGPEDDSIESKHVAHIYSCRYSNKLLC